MNNLNFYNKKPGCFKSFNLVDAQDVKTGWVTGSEFLSKYVICKCGNGALNIYASFGNDMNLAPLVVECPICGVKEEIFNPEIHGWDGENGDNCSSVGESEPKLLPVSPTRLVTEYSYQGAENYEDLIEEGVVNPEDYFDTFALYSVSDSGKLSEVVSYECA